MLGIFYSQTAKKATMGSISKKELENEAMELALFLHDVYTETQISQGEIGQIDANTSNDTN